MIHIQFPKLMRYWITYIKLEFFQKSAWVKNIIRLLLNYHIHTKLLFLQSIVQIFSLTIQIGEFTSNILMAGSYLILRGI